MAKPKFEKSADTLIIENRLRNSQPGELVTYDDLTRLLGRDVRTSCYGNLRRALHNLERDHIVFLTVRAEGVKRANDTEAAESADSFRQAAHRANRRMVKRICAVKDFESLPKETKQRALTLQTIAGIVDLATSSKGVAKVNKVIENSALPVGKTLDLFK